MATDNYSGILFNQGEGLSQDDLNDLQNYAQASVYDRLFERMAPALICGTDATFEPDPEMTYLQGDRNIGSVVSSVIYTLGVGDCAIAELLATSVKIGAGTLFQKVAAKSGTSPTFLPYEVKSTDFSFTIQPGHATLPRYDIIQVKLELVSTGSETRDFEDAITRVVTSTSLNKRYRVQCTMSYKQGTAAATPTHPLPDAGYATLAAVRVPAAWTTGIASHDPTLAGSQASLMQCSIPLGVEVIDVLPHEFDYVSGGAANWARNSFGEAAASASATGLTIWCPRPDRRVIGVAIQGSFQTSASAALASASWVSSVSHYQFSTIVTPSGLVTPSASNTFGYANIEKLMGSSSAGSTSAIAGNPVWGNASFRPNRNPISSFSTLSFPQTGGRLPQNVALRVDGGTGSLVVGARWYLAGGR